MQHKFGLIRFHLDLFENDALLLLDVALAKQRIQHQICEHVQSKRQVLIQNLGIEADQFFTGKRVESAAH